MVGLPMCTTVHQPKKTLPPGRQLPLDRGAVWFMAGLMLLGICGHPMHESPKISAKPNGIQMHRLVTVPSRVPKPAPPSRESLDNGFLLVQNPKPARLFQSIIVEAANRYEVEPEMVNAIIMAESSYNPVAVSEKGAAGLMQLMPDTAADMGVIDIFDPRHNIHGGVRYFRFLLNQLDNDPELALAAYHAGITRVLEYEGIPPFRATEYYIRKVLTYYQFYKKNAPASLESA
jgi:hypothetical protein